MGSASGAAVGTAAAPLSVESFFTEVARQLNYIFFNRAPSVAPVWYRPNGPGKQILVDVNGQSNNGFGLTYAIKDGPRYGTVVIDAATGKYTYSPDSSLVTPGITDRFTITVDNGSYAQLPGLAGVVRISCTISRSPSV